MTPEVLWKRHVDRTSNELGELARLFFRLGATAFGGPAAHIAMMRDEVVVRRKWLDEARFLDLLGATNLIPGPNSTELAMHIGWERAGLLGLVVAGTAFIVPAMLITGVFGYAYVAYGTVPTATWLLYGVKPLILGVVIQAIIALAPKAARTTSLRALAVLVAVSALLGVHEIALLFGAGALTMVARRVAKPPAPEMLALPLFPLASAGMGAMGGGASLGSIFLVFAKIGAVLFGSGYVLLAFLREDLVERLHWLTEAQLIDAIAVGQITPGPVFTTATFIGYVIAGPSGAGVATLGIFLPAFVFVALSGPLVPRIRSSPSAAAFLDGVNVASLALMIVVTLQLGQAAIVDVPTALLGLCGAVLLVRYEVNATWLIALGAASGYAIHALGLAGT
jgi:chromate transporter